MVSDVSVIGIRQYGLIESRGAGEGGNGGPENGGCSGPMGEKT